MTTVSYYARTMMAVVAAFAMTASLMVGSFSADPQVQSLAGLVA